MAKVARALDYLFITRPVLFYPIWTVFLAGFIASERESGKDLLRDWWGGQSQWFTFSFAIAFASLTFLMAAVFIINQFTDIHSDKENNKLFLLANGLVAKKAARVEIGVFLIAAFALSLNSSLLLTTLLICLFLLTGIAYNLPPLSWKDRPYSGFAVNLLGGLITFLIGWSTYGEISWISGIKAVPYLLAIGAVYCLTTIPDLKGDRNSGKITLAVRFGPKWTTTVAAILELACIVVALWQRDWLIFIPALAALPFFVRLFFSRALRGILQATRFPILFLSISVGLFSLAYFILMLGVYLLSKWYYLNRFQLLYPSLARIAEES